MWCYQEYKYRCKYRYKYSDLRKDWTYQSNLEIDELIAAIDACTSSNFSPFVIFDFPIFYNAQLKPLEYRFKFYKMPKYICIQSLGAPLASTFGCWLFGPALLTQAVWPMHVYVMYSGSVIHVCIYDACKYLGMMDHIWCTYLGSWSLILMHGCLYCMIYLILSQTNAMKNLILGVGGCAYQVSPKQNIYTSPCSTDCI